MITDTLQHHSSCGLDHEEATSIPIAGQRRLLIVEDDDDIRRGWSVVLRHRGFDAVCCASGSEALGILLDEPPDLLLLDLGLPGMHGLKLLHELRMSGSAVPVVVATASLDATTGRRALRAGAARVLTKPVAPVEVVEVIENVLGI